MIQKTIRFVLLLALVSAAVYGAQRFLLFNFSESTALDFLHFSYKFNVGFTLIFTSTIILISEKLGDQIGFVFLAEGVIKIGLFLYLASKMGFNLDRSNFFLFFIPYLSCLLVEVFFVIRLLKDLDHRKDK